MAAELLNGRVGDWTLVEYRDTAGKSSLVFKATRGDETAALKIFDPELIERFGEKVQAERIQRELSLRGKHHPHLVRILDGGCCAKRGLWFVAMGYVDAPNLATVLQDVPRERIWPIIEQVASAARFLETLGLAHRDIKPDNIAVGLDFQHSVLLDLGVIRPFGVAGLTDEDQRVFVGTLQYSPPEFLFRLEKDSLEGWRGVTFYQLGAVLHDLIMRRRLFSELCEPFARLVEAVKHEIPRIDPGGCSPDLVVLTRNCLQKDPELRLRFVRWEDFDVRERRPTHAADAKERIRKRRGYAHVGGVTGADTETEQKDRMQRRSINAIRTRLQEVIREICISSDLFPPMEIHDIHDGRPDWARFRVGFCLSVEHGLFEPLAVWFEVRLLDAEAEAVSLGCLAALGSRLEAVDVSGQVRAMIFEGAFAEDFVRPLLADILFPLLDNVQQVVRAERSGKGSSACLWLKVRTSGEEEPSND